MLAPRAPDSYLIRITLKGALRSNTPFRVRPPPTADEQSRQMTRALNEAFEKKGWVSDGKGGWTSDTNTIQTYRKLNAEMEKAGWITVSNGHYVLPTNSEVLRRLETERHQE